MPATFYIASLPFQDALQNGGSARGYHAIFVPSTALASPGYDGQPAVYLYIAALEMNVLNCRIPPFGRTHRSAVKAAWATGCAAAAWWGCTQGSPGRPSQMTLEPGERLLFGDRGGRGHANSAVLNRDC